MSTLRIWIREFSKDHLAVLGLFILLVFIIITIFAPFLSLVEDPIYTTDLAHRLEPPSLNHPFGTDHMGRDIFSRVLLGGRITLYIATVTILIALSIGVPVGLIAGYYEEFLGGFLMRIVDIVVSIPRVILALALAAALGPSVRNAVIAIGLTYWPWWSRVVYAETKSVKRDTFIESTRSLGAGTFRTLFLHILPNIIPTIIVRTTMGMAGAILTAAVLGYLGLGASPPTPEWGLTISESRSYLPKAWWFATFPGFSIFAVTLGFNLFGDGLRDVLDPTLRRSKGEK